MKKFFVVLVSIIILCTVCGCDGNNSAQPKTVQETSSSKINGEITAASDYSEGLAFVSLNGNEEKTYCINKKGEIVFELDQKLSVNGNIFEKFHNGYALIGEAICDTKGKLTYPKDVGATKFSLLAIEDGYIIAEVKNVAFDSTDIKIGVLDTSFKWVLEPSAEVGEKLNGLPIESLNTESYYQKGIVCYDIHDNDIEYLYFNVKTGEISENSPYPLPSNKWQRTTNGWYGNYNEETTLDLSSKYDNIACTTEFVNGKSGIVFCNASQQEYFFTLINEKGELQFDPVSCGYEVCDIIYDGKFVLITNGRGSETGAKCYNDKGNLLGEITKDMIPDKDWASSYSLADGVVTVRSGYNYSHKCYYFKTNAKKLF